VGILIVVSFSFVLIDANLFKLFLVHDRVAIKAETPDDRLDNVGTGDVEAVLKKQAKKKKKECLDKNIKINIRVTSQRTQLMLSSKSWNFFTY